MQDVQNSVDVSYEALSLEEWKQAIEDLAEEHGAYQPLDDTHLAAFVEAGKTLLVTFENIDSIRETPGNARPLGHELVLKAGWSHLAILSDSESWFRNPRIYGYFDRLIDDGFFEDFDRVVFYGAGACGYAAAAFSVAAPGATVLAVQPHATMDPRMTEWDPRYPQARRLNFTDRFGYAPDMLDAADRGFVLYDPYEDVDAMHAALFERNNVTRLRLPFQGDNLEKSLWDMGLLLQLIEHAGEDTLNSVSFAQAYRTRRNNVAYLRRLLAHLDARDRRYLSYVLCRYVISDRKAPHFQRRLRTLRTQAVQGAFRAPPARQAAAAD